MSDETARLVASVAPNGDLDRRQGTKAGVWEHYCEHPGCEKWGAFGFIKGRQQAWFCFEHRADGERGIASPR